MGGAVSYHWELPINPNVIGKDWLWEHLILEMLTSHTRERHVEAEEVPRHTCTIVYSLGVCFW